MKSQTGAAWNAVSDRQLNPSASANRASRLYLAEMLVWIWSVMALLLLLSMFVLDNFWLGQMLLIAGVVISVTLSRRSQTRRQQRRPVPHLSGASKCVWQMDREG